jgi:hypothetical protein
VRALFRIRREFAAVVVASLASLLALPALPQSDRGIGGTGVTQDDADPAAGRDRGIGGTGVIGTIRGFGSIIVNGVHISYPREASVRVDGRAGTTADLKIGQVVRVVARGRGDRLTTRSIEVTSEVVGPVDAVARQGLTVVGQQVSISSLKGGQQWRVGDVVAVSGLRRPDGTIVASLVERRSADRVRIAGVAAPAPDGGVRIGGAKLADLPTEFIGNRISLEGALVDGAVRVAAVRKDQDWLSRAGRFSVESYVERGPAGIRLGSGLEVSGRVAARIPPGKAALAVVTGTAKPGGGLVVDGVRLDGGVGTGRPGPGQRSLLDPASPVGSGLLDPRTLPLDLRTTSPSGLVPQVIDGAGGGTTLGFGGAGGSLGGVGATTGGAVGGTLGGVGGVGSAVGGVGLPAVGTPPLSGGLLNGRR